MRNTAIRKIGMLVVAAAVAGTVACNRSETPPPAAQTPTTAPAPDAVDHSDAAITTNVQAKFYADDMVRGRDISVAADDGAVTLSGSVESDAAKDKAASLARAVPGVTEVKNELRVETAVAERSADPSTTADRPVAGTAGRENAVQPGWITTKIQAQYFVNPELKPWNIDVTTNGTGVVTLEGQVDSADDRAEAVRLARATEGVSTVEDHLRIKGEAAGGAASAVQRPDAWLTAKVQSKYFLDDVVKGRNIDVDTADGVVTLKGTVAGEAERRTAIALARSTEGVKSVNSQLALDAKLAESSASRRGVAPVPDLKRPDSWITMKIQSQFFLDPDIKAHEVNVDTTRGVVLLKGTVETAAQKERAEQIARDTEGVARVTNQLKVEAQ